MLRGQQRVVFHSLPIFLLLLSQYYYGTSFIVSAAKQQCDESKCRSPADVEIGVYDCWIKPMTTTTTNGEQKEELDELLCDNNLIPNIIDSIPITEDGYQYYTCCYFDDEDEDTEGQEQQIPSSYQEDGQQQQEEDLHNLPSTPPPSTLSRRRECDPTRCTSISLEPGVTDCFVLEELNEIMMCSSGNEPRVVASFPWEGFTAIQYTCCEINNDTTEDEEDPLLGENDENNNDDDHDDEIKMQVFYSEHCSQFACNSYSQDGGTDCYVAADFGITVEKIQCRDNNDGNKYVYPWIVQIVDDFEMQRYGRMDMLEFICCDIPPPTNDGSLAGDANKYNNRIYWLCVPLAIVSYIVFFTLILFIYGTLSSHSLRKHTFYLYLVMLEIPDAILNLASAILLTLRLIQFGGNGKFSQTDHCIYLIPAMVLVVAIANIWLSTVIGHEVLTLLILSKKRSRAYPPSFRKVVIQAIVIFLISIADGIATFYCNVRDNVAHIWNPVSAVVLLGIPFFYMVYACIRVLKQGLFRGAPGRTRGIALYFGRLVIIFFVMYFPGTILASRGGALGVAGLYLLSLQGFVSVLVARYTNKDIAEAMDFSRHVPRLPSKVFAMKRIISNSSLKGGLSASDGSLKSFDCCSMPGSADSDSNLPVGDNDDDEEKGQSSKKTYCGSSSGSLFGSERDLVVKEEEEEKEEECNTLEETNNEDSVK